MQNRVILVIDDDPNIRMLLERAIQRMGAQVFSAANVSDGLRLFREQKPDLVLLDIVLPDATGWEALEHIRKISRTPIIMVTSLTRDNEVVRGLSLGADDYITKPFNLQVLQARIQTVLRRANHTIAFEKQLGYQDDYLNIDIKQHCVTIKGKEVKLTPTEFRLLSYLLENTGRLTTHQQILDNVWGSSFQDTTGYIHVYISHLRRKIEPDPKNPTYLVGEHGSGYRFQKKTIPRNRA